MTRLSLLLSIFASSLAFGAPARMMSSTPNQEMQWALQRIFANLADPQVARGAVIASPSKRDPDYYFHWVRDAGLTMSSLAWTSPSTPVSQALQSWAAFERKLQTESKTGQGLGEPKFHVNGSLFRGPWGRPQNDGPAIRAWTFLNAFGAMDPMVREDLDYLKAHWGEPNFDLWEEVKGHHFFTRYAQMTAFRTAAALEARQGRAKDASEDDRYARLIEGSLNDFIDASRMLVRPSVGVSDGPTKPAGLDVSVILAVTYFGPSAKWSVSQPYVLSTALRLEDTFRALYPINTAYPDMAPAIGRYPEDVYDGVGFSKGHPWFLATFGLGEFYCALAEETLRRGEVRIDAVNRAFFERLSPGLTSRSARWTASQPEFRALVTKLRDRGQSFLFRSYFHGGADRRYSEQFDRDSGFRRGAMDLTWSHAAALRAAFRCQRTSEAIQGAFR